MDLKGIDFEEVGYFIQLTMESTGKGRMRE
jgi:hypothetical protein